jgi:hypothetical protein
MGFGPMILPTQSKKEKKRNKNKKIKQIKWWLLL